MPSRSAPSSSPIFSPGVPGSRMLCVWPRSTPISRDSILPNCAVGVFGRVAGMDHVLEAGDRVEIYRPLAADPKVSRRQRAKQLRR